MGEFTVQSKKVDKAVKKQLDVICKELLLRIKGIKSIILTGGFAIGEGPVKVIKSKIYPYNDYDICIITNKKINSNKIDAIASQIMNKFGLKGINYFYSFKKEEQTLKDSFYVDLKCYTIKELRNFLPRLRYYSLKNSSKGLYGQDYRHLIPDYQIRDIPLSEPFKILLDRISQLVEYYSRKGTYDKEILIYFIQQAYAACSTALLMLINKWHPSYKISMERLYKIYKKKFPKLYKKLPNLHLKIRKYITWKLNPKKLPDKNINKVWFESAKNIIIVTKYFMSKYLKKGITTDKDLSNSILKISKLFYKPYIKRKFNIKSDLIYSLLFPFASLYLKFKYFLRIKKISNRFLLRIFFNKYTPDSYIFASVIYLILAINEERINLNYLKKFKNLLKKVYLIKGKNWESLSIDYANAYIAFFLQKFD